MTLRPFLLLTALLSITAFVPASAQSSTAKPTPAKTAVRKPATTAKPAVAKPLPPVGGVKPEDRARDMTMKMQEALDLTMEQFKRVQQINLQSVQRMEEARQQYIKDLPKMRAEVDRIGTSRLSLLKDVLTEAQFRAYTAMREKKMGIPESLKQQAEAAGGE